MLMPIQTRTPSRHCPQETRFAGRQRGLSCSSSSSSSSALQRSECAQVPMGLTLWRSPRPTRARNFSLESVETLAGS